MMAASDLWEEYEQYYGPPGKPHGLLMLVLMWLQAVIWEEVIKKLLDPDEAVKEVTNKLVNDGLEAIKKAVTEHLGPVGLLLLHVSLIIVISVLSSDEVKKLLNDGVETIKKAVKRELLSSVGLLVLPISLITLIRVLSYSPVGVTLFLFLLMTALLLYYRRSALFGGDGATTSSTDALDAEGL